MTYLSQNFLINHKILPQIIFAANLKPDDIVIEIGPGKGILTEQLCQKAGQVIAIELDQNLLPGLEILASKYPNLQIIHQDFTKYDWRQLVAARPYKIIANIPYHITGLIIRVIFQANQSLPSDVVLMVQYEVAKKILAKPDNQNILSNLIKCYGEPKLIVKVDKKDFRPIPKIDSAVIAVTNIHQPLIADFEDYFRLVKIGFSSRRKTLTNNLSSGLKKPKSDIIKLLEKIPLDPSRRAQTLTIEEWRKIYEIIK